MNFITSTDRLKDFCHSIAEEERQGYITVDTEFHREDTYWPQLCLIQIAGSKRHALIDPLAASMDLLPLKELLFDASVTKVFHSARQDLEIFYQLWGDLPKPLFDTQIAAMACGFGESVAYSNLVETFTKQKIDKTSQVTNWTQRPLTQKQMLYALQDVTYLRTVYAELFQNLEALGRLSWVAGEMDFLLDPTTYQADPDKLLYSLKPRVKSTRYLARLREIAITRDAYAQAQNVPRSRIVRDQTLLEMASSSIASIEDFDNLRGVGQNFSKRPMAKDFLEALERAASLPLSECPKYPKKTHAQNGLEPLVDLLRVYLKQASLQHNIAAKMIAATADLYDIAASDQPECRAMRGWRYDIFGKEALALKKGEKVLRVKDGRLILSDYNGFGTPTKS